MTENADRRPRIVVGVDGSEQSKLALRWAARIAAAEDAQLDAVLAWDLPTLAYGYLGNPDAPRREMETLLARTIDDVFRSHVPPALRRHVIRGQPAPTLLAASRGALMLVVGSRGHGGFSGLLLGSVSAKVAEHAPCPVLVVHEPADHRVIEAETAGQRQHLIADVAHAPV